MKTISKRLAIPLLAALVWSSAAEAAPAPAHFRGCVRVGVEPGCLAVQSGPRLYNIGAARPRPALGRAIAGTGFVQTGGVGWCAGTRLTRIRWHYIRMPCPRPPHRPYRR